MKEFQQKQENRSKLYSKYSLFILFVLIILAAKGILSISAKERGSREEMISTQSKEAGLEKRYNNLQSRVSDLKTGEGVEKEIRSKFDVVKPGEHVILVVDKEVPQSTEQDPSFFKKIWNGMVHVFKKSK